MTTRLSRNGHAVIPMEKPHCCFTDVRTVPLILASIIVPGVGR